MHWTGQVDSIAFYIGNKGVAWYGIFITCAMLVGLWIGARRMRRLQVSTDQSLTLFLIVIPAAVIAARLGYVVANYSTYFVRPYDWDAFVRTIAIWEGGLTILWGVPGGVLAGIIWCRMYKKDFLRSADIVLSVALLSQALGRWGNFMNQELYGQIVTNPAHQWFPLSVFIAADMSWHQATFFYEMVLNFAGFVVLSVLYKRVNVRGFTALGYAAWYTLTRAVMEFFRVEQNTFEKKLGFNVVQVICFAVGAVCVAVMVAMCLWKRYRKGERVWYAHGFDIEQPIEPRDLEDNAAPTEA